MATQLALLSLSIQHFVALLVPNSSPWAGSTSVFHCSNKCRLRELNGDLQTIEHPGGQREREALLKTRPRWTDARKMYRVGFHGWTICNSDREEFLGCVLCGKPWQPVGALGREGHEMWRAGAGASLGRVGGRAAGPHHHPRPRTRTPGAGPGC